ncbi:uncharacterized protein LOC116772026 isoform X1 [Danaus plexippus]|uniref:uncharacterized protein LOC116772026 isoform X1 n=1 Tax=Danaus plexippus TaxID=13037 RepID=UPI002AB0ED06|nr:uncharacterized protein LOC116772026 isoform X1 [Danaus plexippus]
MQRKPGYPATANNMKMELGLGMEYVAQCDFASESQCDDDETQQRRQQLINFGHSQWGFNNWSWLVTSQALDFVENHNGIYTAGVACFVSVKVKSLDIQRVNVGYATSVAAYKGLSIHRARMCSVTNGLLETLLSFGGNLASELMELLESNKNEAANHIMVPEAVPESSSNPLIKTEPKNLSKPINRKDTEANVNLPQVFPQKGPKNTLNPPVAKAHPMPANLAINMSTNLPNPPTTPAANLPPAANAPRPPYAAPPAPAPAHVRPNSNVSFVMMPPLYAPPRLPPPHAFPNYYELSPWHFSYEPHNLNLNLNMPSRNLLVGRDCKREDFQPQQGCWIKPTIFYDGFWTEQKVRKWVAEQVEKQFPEDKTTSPADSTTK